jgi:hypothetical protein
MQKTILLKLFQEWGEGRMKKSDEGVNSNMVYLIHCENLCKCHNTPPPSKTIKGRKENLLTVLKKYMC